MSLGEPSHTLLIGPSGSGKTYMLSLLCDAAGISFVRKSMANVSSEGYKGENLSEVLETLATSGTAQQRQGRPAIPGRGIIFLDEFDKIRMSESNDGSTDNLFPRKLQQELLAYLTGEKIHGVDTSKYMIVGAGAFHGGFGKKSLYDIIQKRLGGSQAQVKPEQLLEQLEDQDLVEYGFMPEIVGRITNKAALTPIDEEGLYKILKETENSPTRNVQEKFRRLGINLQFEDEALREIARVATSGVGVRGLHGVVNSIVEAYSFDRMRRRGQDISITLDEVQSKLKREAEFVEPDEFEINWKDPRSIVAYLDQYVAGQTEAKRELAKAFHLYHMGLQTKGRKLPKANVMLVGPSGSGKTYMVELLAKKAQLPFGKTNMTGKVPEGYGNGERFSSVFEQMGRSESGIVYIDEADKVLLDPSNPLNNELIGCLENGEVSGRSTGRYLFVLSGAFQPLYEGKRSLRTQESKKLGFEVDREAQTYADGTYEGLSVSRADLLSSGISREALGRIPIIANVPPLSVNDLTEILRKKGSVLEQYTEYFGALGKQLDIDDSALRIMAEKALGLQGARGLSEVANQLFDHYIMNSDGYGKTIKVTGEEAREVLYRRV